MSEKQPNSTPKKWLFLNVFLAVALIAGGAGALWWAFQQSGDGNERSATIDVSAQAMAAPDFSLTDLTGQTVSLRDFSGQVVLLNFWATWCPPCIAELPTLDAFYRDHRADGLVVLAINAEEDRAAIEAFLRETGLSLPVLMDTDGEVMRRYDVRALPVSVIIDRSGVIRTIHRGEITRKQLDSLVLPLSADE